MYALLSLAAGGVCAIQFAFARRKVERLRLGRDGERAVAEQLERLRERGAEVVHDVPGEGFNLDHVLLCQRGFYVIETKTRTKPARGDARVRTNDGAVIVGRSKPDRAPVVQVQAGAAWLTRLLEECTGKRFAVRGVIVFPGWFVEPMSAVWKQAGMPWVLEPKALPRFIENEPSQFEERDVKLAAAQLAQYVRRSVSDDP